MDSIGNLAPELLASLGAEKASLLCRCVSIKANFTEEDAEQLMELGGTDWTEFKVTTELLLQIKTAVRTQRISVDLALAKSFVLFSCLQASLQPAQWQSDPPAFLHKTLRMVEVMATNSRPTISVTQTQALGTALYEKLQELSSSVEERSQNLRRDLRTARD